MTKYEMAMAIAQAFNLPSDHLIPVHLNTSVSKDIDSEMLELVFDTPVCVCVSTADRAAGCIHSSATEQSAELFSSGAAEPQRGSAAVCLRHR